MDTEGLRDVNLRETSTLPFGSDGGPIRDGCRAQMGPSSSRSAVCGLVVPALPLRMEEYKKLPVYTGSFLTKLRLFGRKCALAGAYVDSLLDLLDSLAHICVEHVCVDIEGGRDVRVTEDAGHDDRLNPQ